MQTVFIILVGITVAIIGALPFGLVNLTVLDTAYRKGKKQAMHIAHGAAWIEILFGLTAIVLGKRIIQLTHHILFIHYLFIFLPGVVGIIFLFKKSTNHSRPKIKNNGLLKGIFLNLVSLQVLLYWIIAITYLISNQILALGWWFNILIFLVGIWIGKMSVLWLYAFWSNTIFNKWQFLSSNMNRVIGSILLFTVLIQFFK